MLQYRIACTPIFRLVCTVRLAKLTFSNWRKGRRGVYYPHTVERRECASPTLSLSHKKRTSWPKGNVVKLHTQERSKLCEVAWQGNEVCEETQASREEAVITNMIGTLKITIVEVGLDTHTIWDYVMCINTHQYCLNLEAAQGKGRLSSCQPDPDSPRWASLIRSSSTAVHELMSDLWLNPQVTVQAHLVRPEDVHDVMLLRSISTRLNLIGALQGLLGWHTSPCQILLLTY